METYYIKYSGLTVQKSLRSKKMRHNQNARAVIQAPAKLSHSELVPYVHAQIGYVDHFKILH